MLWSVMAAAKEYTTIEVSGQEVRVSSPGKVYFPEPGFTKLDLVQYYLETRRGHRPRPLRPPHRAQALEGRHHRRGLLPEARAREAPRVAADRHGALPLRSQRRPSSCPTTPPTSSGASTSATSTGTRGRCAAATSTIPTSCASTSIRSPASSGARSARWRCAPATCCASTGCSASPRRAARAASTSTSASSRAGASPRCAAPRWRWRARSSGACPDAPRRRGGRRSASASSSTTTRTRATAPSPRSTRCARCPTRRCRARCAGTRWPTSSPRTCAWTPFPRACARSATSSETIDDVHHSLDALLDLARRDEEEGLGDAPWPPHFAKQAGEPKRVQPSRARGDG